MQRSLDGRLVFVVGFPRSGTYWLQRVISAHRDVAAVPNETHIFSRVVAPLVEQFHHGARSSPSSSGIYIDRAVLMDHVRRLCDDVLAPHMTPGARLLSERSPWHVRHLDLIGEVYPGARFVHIVRDPRDVARSMVSHDWGPDSLEEAAGQWVESVGLARATTVDHCLQLRYEDLLSDVAGGSQAVYEWLGLDASPARVEEAVRDAAVHVNRDPAGSAVGTAKWQDLLDPGEVAAVEGIAGDLMAELGYDRASTAGTRPAAPSSAPAPARSVRGAITRRLRPARPAASSGPRPDPALALTVFDRLTGALHTGDSRGIAALLAPDATVRLVQNGSETLRSGEEGLAELARAAEEDTALRGRQLESQIDSTFPTTVGIFTYAREAGPPARRVVVVSARQDRVAHVTLIAIEDP